jgi:hypothetical protein
MKVYKRSRIIAQLIFTLGARWRRVVIITPRNEPRYPLIRRLGGPHSRAGPSVEEKNLLPLLGFEPWTVQPVA